MAKETASAARKTAYLGLLAAAAILCGYIEFLIPFNFGIPGVKLGLSNFVILIVLYTYGFPGALAVSLVRVLVTGFLFGNLFSMAYSLAGAVLSLAVMALLKRTGKFAIVGISAAGGAFHNIGQMIVAYAVTPALPLLWYLPVLMIAGVVTGIIIGIIAGIVLSRITPLVNRV